MSITERTSKEGNLELFPPTAAAGISEGAKNLAEKGYQVVIDRRRADRPESNEGRRAEDRAEVPISGGVDLVFTRTPLSTNAEHSDRTGKIEKVTIGNAELWYGDCLEVLPLS